MNEPLAIIGYLNLYGRDVTPIALDAIFQRGDQRFLCRSEGEVVLSDAEIASYEADSFIQWIPAMPVSTTAARLLYHEEASEVMDGKPVPRLTFSYLDAEAEFALRTQLAMAYLDRADDCLRRITEASSLEVFQSACDWLERVARSRPDFITARVIKAIVANEFDDAVGVAIELADIEFEWSRLDMPNWQKAVAQALPNQPNANRWTRFAVAGNKLSACTDDAPQNVYETMAQVDPLSVKALANITKWTTPGGVPVAPVFWPSRNLLFTSVLLDLIGTHQKFLPDAIAARHWQICLMAFSQRQQRKFSLATQSCIYHFWPWHAENLPAGATYRGAQTLSERLQNMYSRHCPALQTKEIVIRANRYPRPNRGGDYAAQTYFFDAMAISVIHQSTLITLLTLPVESRAIYQILARDRT